MNKIRLPRDGAEYVHFTFSSLPTGAVFEAQIGSGPWTALDMTGKEPRLLVKGPAAPAGTSGLLVSEDGQIRARVRDTPEVVVRGAGYISLVS